MNKVLSVFVGVLLFTSSSLHCELFSSHLKLLQSEVEKVSFEKNSEKAKAYKEIATSNLHFLEASLKKAIDKNYSKIENYKAQLKRCENGADAQYWLKKIKSKDKKNNKLHEIKLSLEILKLKLDL